MIALCGVLVCPARGATILWANTGTDFGTGVNWSGGTAPVNDTTTDIASFGTVAPTFQPDLGAARSVTGVVFANGAGAFTLASGGGFTLTLGASGLSQQSTEAQIVSLALNLVLKGVIGTTTGTLTASGSGTLTLMGVNK